MKQCSVAGCINKHKCHEYCSTHYKHYLKYGHVIDTTNRFHGSSNTPEYRSWLHMKQRCYDTKNHAYKNYGGRGITVCERWLENFHHFLADMGKRPNGTSLDRINVDGNYDPSNCRWATIHEQSANKRNSSPVVGVNWDMNNKSWRATLVVSRHRVLSKRFKEYDEAVKARKEAEILHGLSPILTIQMGKSGYKKQKGAG